MEVKSLKIFFSKKQKDKILKDVSDILDSGQLAAGEYVEKFEKEWSKINNCNYGCAVSSGGSALDVIFRALDLEGKEVILPTNTFIATYNSIHFAGAKPVLADVSRSNMCLDLENIKKNFNSNTGAVCLVHIGGVITDEIHEIKKFCDDNKIYLIEDAAHGHGSSFDGKYPGQFGIAAAYSFFSTKTFTSGEGGMVLTNDKLLDENCRRLRDYGKKSQWESVHTVLSSNYRMSNITASVGLSHISEINEFLKKRRAIAKIYDENLSQKFERLKVNNLSGWYKYTVYLPKEVDRSEFKEKSKQKGVGLPGGVYDLPLHLQPVLKHLNLDGKLSIAEDVCGRHICLPIYPNLDDKEVEFTYKTLNDLIDSYE